MSASPKKTLLVPIHMDGLYLSEANKVHAPILDFKNIPHFKSSPKVAYIADTLKASGDEDKTQLQAGLHLHWALPDALTKSMGLRIIRKSEFETKLPDNIVGQIWTAMIQQKWISEISPGIAISEKRNVRLKNLDASKVDSILLKYLELINLLLDQPNLPPAPNRWMISAFSDPKTIEKCWYLESDYQYPMSTSPGAGAHVAFPYFKEILTENNIKTFVTTEAYQKDENYRIIGRKQYCKNSFSNLSGSIDLKDYTSQAISALGFGDPNFAAFYPNCINIFGIRAEADGNTPQVPAGTYYEVIGWHSDPELDYYGLFVNNFITQKITPGKAQYLDLLNSIMQQFRWLVPIMVKKSAFANIPEIWGYLIKIGWLSGEPTADQAEIAPAALEHEVQLDAQYLSDEGEIIKIFNAAIQAQLPNRMLCYARRSINLKGKSPSTFKPTAIEVVAGRTGAEAMAALVAKSSKNKLSKLPKNQVQIEDQLAALLYAGKLSGQQLDRAAKLAEARHDKAFLAENGGSIWSIRPLAFNNTVDDKIPDSQITLPLELADLLNHLNLAQQALDRHHFKIQSTRKQIYLDWCKYQYERYDYQDPQHDDKAKDIRDYLMNRNGKNKNPQSTYNLVGMVINQGTLAIKLEEAKEKVTQLLKEHDYIGFEGISDWPVLVRHLQQQQYVNFPPAFVKLLSSFKPDQLSSTQQLSILAALNAVIDDGSFPLKGQAKDLPKNAYAIWQHQGQDIPQSRFNRLMLESLFPSIKKTAHYILQTKAAPRFWEPRDPVILFNGDQLNPNTRNGSDGLLKPQVMNFDLKVVGSKLKPDPDWAKEVLALFNAVHPLLSQLQKQFPKLFAFTPQTEYPAHPFMLDWGVEFHPAYSKTSDYQADYISSNYQLEENAVDFTYKSTRPLDRDTPRALEGRTLLSAHAGNRLQQALDDYLLTRVPNKNYSDFFAKNEVIQCFSPGINEAELQAKIDKFIPWCQSRIQLKNSYFERNNVPPTSRDDYYIQEHLQQFQQWLQTEVKTLYKSIYSKMDFNVVVATIQNEIAAAYHTSIYIFCDEYLKNTKVISQSLGGFHEALLMQKIGYQLGVYDPCSLKYFPIPNVPPNSIILKQHETIRNAVGTQNITSPVIDGAFNPVRAGGLLLNGLTLIDTFGRTLVSMHQKDFQQSLIKSTPLSMSGHNSQFIGLNPRFAQGARLNFRFLSAADETVEMNDHVATSPICGWIVPNLLDNSLMVYGQDGLALGYIDQNGHWQIYPGNEGPNYPDAIPNPSLSQVVVWICGNASTSGAGFMEDLIEVLTEGIAQANPEYFAQHQALALLMGRPLAVIKTSAELEVKGQLAINQQIDHITNPTEYGYPSTQQFEQVQVPVRLGEYQQLNDGLIGYWIGRPTGSDTLYAPQANGASNSGIIKTRQNDKDFDVALSLAQGSQMITMLVEPQGFIHATSGVLPAKAIQIPPDQYAQALKRIEVAFLTAPLITPSNEVHISLPREDGYHWTWQQNIEGQWQEISNQGLITQADLKKAFSKIWPGLWEELLSQRWIEKVSADTARIVARDQRKSSSLGTAYAAYEAKAEYFLQSHQLFPFVSKAAFSDRQMIKEAWLRLNPDS